MMIIIISFCTFLATLLSLPLYISWAKTRFKQTIREDAPDRHQHKEGTPTMGGLIFFTITALTFSLFTLYGKTYSQLRTNFHFLIPLILIAGGNFLLGFIDDTLKVLRKRNLGLKARHKFIVHILIALLTFYLYKRWNIPTTIEFYTWHLDIGLWYILWLFFIISGTSNAVNLTDGLDGLASTIAILSLLPYTVIGDSMSTTLALLLVSSLLAYLWYNSYPAEVFMGDSGSLFIGGVIAWLALYTKTEPYLIFWALIFWVEALSVILQVIYFKFTRGKRIFKMSPIHHHFELSGWSEPQIVYRFATVQLWATLLGLATFLSLHVNF